MSLPFGEITPIGRLPTTDDAEDAPRSRRRTRRACCRVVEPLDGVDRAAHSREPPRLRRQRDRRDDREQPEGEHREQRELAHVRYLLCGSAPAASCDRAGRDCTRRYAGSAATQRHIGNKSDNLRSWSSRRGSERSRPSPRGLVLPGCRDALREPARGLEARRRARGRARRSSCSCAAARGVDAHAGRSGARRLRPARGGAARERAPRARRRRATRRSGRSSLAASGVPGTYLLPTPLARFRELHPGVDDRLPADDVRGCARARAGARGRARGRRRASIMPPELEAEPLVDDEIVLVGPPVARRADGFARRISKGLTWIVARGGLGHARGGRGRALGARPRMRCARSSSRRGRRSSSRSPRARGSHAISRFALDLELAAGASLVVLDVPRWRRATHDLRRPGARRSAHASRRARSRRCFAKRSHRSEEQLPPNSNLPARADAARRTRAELAEIAAPASRRRGS